jgi:Flagellar hook-length control protein FliK
MQTDPGLLRLPFGQVTALAGSSGPAPGPECSAFALELEPGQDGPADPQEGSAASLPGETALHEAGVFWPVSLLVAGPARLISAQAEWSMRPEATSAETEAGGMASPRLSGDSAERAVRCLAGDMSDSIRLVAQIQEHGQGGDGLRDEPGAQSRGHPAGRAAGLQLSEPRPADLVPEQDSVTGKLQDGPLSGLIGLHAAIALAPDVASVAGSSAKVVVRADVLTAALPLPGMTAGPSDSGPLPGSQTGPADQVQGRLSEMGGLSVAQAAGKAVAADAQGHETRSQAPLPGARNQLGLHQEHPDRESGLSVPVPKTALDAAGPKADPLALGDTPAELQASKPGPQTPPGFSAFWHPSPRATGAEVFWLGKLSGLAALPGNAAVTVVDDAQTLPVLGDGTPSLPGPGNYRSDPLQALAIPASPVVAAAAAVVDVRQSLPGSGVEAPLLPGSGNNGSDPLEPQAPRATPTVPAVTVSAFRTSEETLLATQTAQAAHPAVPAVPAPTGPDWMAPTPPSLTTGPATPTVSVPHLAGHIASTLTQRPDGVTEVALSPEELGGVKLQLQPDARNPDRIVVHLVFDRPETMDLFRRHADQLTEAIRSAGFAEARLDFGQTGSGSGNGPGNGVAPQPAADAGRPDASADDWSAGHSLPDQISILRPSGIAGMDLRL